MNVVTWLAAFRAALDRCADDVEFRRSLPADGEGAEPLLERLAERLGADEVTEDARRRLVERRRPVLDGQLTQLRALDDLTVETRVERRPTVMAELDGGRLSFEGRSLLFPEQALPELEALVLSTARSGPRSYRADSTMPAGSCSCADSYARGCCG